MKKLILFAVCAACGDETAVMPDAPLALDAPTMCPPQAAPLRPGNFKFYLNTEGVALVPGPDNAPANTSQVIMQSVTVPPFYENDSSRQAHIDVIANYVQRALAPYSIDVVLTRPTSGPYYMTVLGGSSLAIAGTANVGSIAPGTCDASNPNRVSLVFDGGSMSAQYYATSILSDFGAMIGMATTKKANDCLCRGDAVCGNANPDLVCSYGVDVPVDQMFNHCGRTTQNEPMILAETFGCR